MLLNLSFAQNNLMQTSKATLVTLGESSTDKSVYGPYNGLWNSKHIQYIYKADELIAAGAFAGKITSLAFYIEELSPVTMLNYTIKLGHTDLVNATTTTPIVTSFVVVKNPFSLDTVGQKIGWKTITFDEPFVWNGTSNIAIDICWGLNETFSSYGKVKTFDMITRNIIQKYSSSANVCEVAANSSNSVGVPSVQFAFMPAITDGGIANIISPNNFNWLWEAGNKEIKVSFKNYGTSNITDAQIEWKINGIAQTTKVFSGNIEPNQKTEVVLGSYNFNTANDFIIEAKILLNNDQDSSNNKFTKTYFVKDGLDVPYSENFDITENDSIPWFWKTVNNTTGWVVKNQNTMGILNPVGATSSPNSIVCFAQPNTAKNDWLFTPYFNFENGKTYNLRFKIKAPGNINGSMQFFPEKLEIKYGTNADVASMTNLLYTLIEDSHYDMEEVSVSFHAPATGKYVIGFHAYSLAGADFISLDDVSIEKMKSTDIKANNIVSPKNYLYVGDSSQVIVNIENIGTQAIDTISFEWKIGETQNVFTWPHTLNSLDDTNIVIIDNFKFTKDSIYDFNIKLIVNNDEDTTNNIIVSQLNVIKPFNIPYNQSFESNDFTTEFWTLESTGTVYWEKANSPMPQHLSKFAQFKASYALDGTNAYLISPFISIPATKNGTHVMKFYSNYFKTTFGEYGSNAELKINIVDSNNIVLSEGNLNYIYNFQDSGWVANALDLKEFEGKTIKIKFLGISDMGSYDIGLDNINLKAYEANKLLFNVIGGNGTLYAFANSKDLTSGDYVANESKVLFTANPNPNYIIKEWKINNTIVAGNNQNTLVLDNFNAETIVTVEFQSSSSLIENENSQIQIYPNPVKNELTIVNTEGLDNVKIIDVLGSSVYEANLNNSKTTIINTELLKNGLYFIQIKTKANIVTKRIIKQ